MISAAPTPSSRSAHPICEVVRLRAARRVLWLRNVWSSDTPSPSGPAVSDEEIDRLLGSRMKGGRDEDDFYESDHRAAQLGDAIRAAERHLQDWEPWTSLLEAFTLTEPERILLLSAVALTLEPSLGRAYAYLHDQPEMSRPTMWLANSLSDVRGPDVLPGDSPLLCWRLLTPGLEAFAVPESWRAWIADPSVVDILDGETSPTLPQGSALITGSSFKRFPKLYPRLLDEMSDFLTLASQEELDCAVRLELVGAPNCGRQVLAGQLAGMLGKDLLAVDERTLLDGVSETEAETKVLEAVRWSFRNALLFWRSNGASSAVVRRVLARVRGVAVVALETLQGPETGEGIALKRTFEIPPLAKNERLALWEWLGGGEAPKQVRQWLVTPGEISRIFAVRSAGDDAIQQACSRPSASSHLLSRLPLPYQEEDLILPPATRAHLSEFENQVRFRWEVYEDWGFQRLCPTGRGIIALFGGPSGTGKTMAAQVIARRLGLELYRLDPAQVVDKYIGETEKRLKSIFDECDRAHFMLLIDECEGLFGQRFAAKDAHDRYANLEINYLLQRLEHFQGVAILATNRKSDLDSAFLRRIRFVIEFSPPSLEDRILIWKSALVENSPSGESLLEAEVDWQYLASKATLTAAEIKLAALNAAFVARSNNERIGMQHLKGAISRQLVKKGETVRGLD